MLFLSLNTGAIVGISVAAAAVVIIAAVVFVVLKKRPRLIDHPLDKEKVIEIYDVPQNRHMDKIIVPVTHVALLEKDGAISTALSAGKFNLTERGEKRDKIRIYFLSKTAKIETRWGTQKHQRLNYLDPKIKKPVSVGAFGTMDVKVSNANKFFQEIVPQDTVFTTEQLEDEIRNKTVDGLRRILISVLTEKHISYYDFETARSDIQERIGFDLAEKFKNSYGLEICDFYIDNINITPEEEADIKRMQIEDSRLNRMEMLEDRELDRADLIDDRAYARQRLDKERRIADLDIDTALYEVDKQRRRDEFEYERKARHEEEDRRWAREDKVLDIKAHITEKSIDADRDVGVATADAMASVAAAENSNTKLHNLGHHCSVCGAAYDPASKYCPVCGATVKKPNESVVCPICHTSAPWGTAYCPGCGHNLRKKHNSSYDTKN